MNAPWLRFATSETMQNSTPRMWVIERETSHKLEVLPVAVMVIEPNLLPSAGATKVT